MASPRDSKNMTAEEWELPEVKDKIYYLVCMKNSNYEDVVRALEADGRKATEWRLKQLIKIWGFHKGVDWDNYPYEETSTSTGHQGFDHARGHQVPACAVDFRQSQERLGRPYGGASRSEYHRLKSHDQLPTNQSINGRKQVHDQATQFGQAQSAIGSVTSAESHRQPAFLYAASHGASHKLHPNHPATFEKGPLYLHDQAAIPESLSQHPVPRLRMRPSFTPNVEPPVGFGLGQVYWNPQSAYADISTLPTNNAPSFGLEESTFEGNIHSQGQGLQLGQFLNLPSQQSSSYGISKDLIIDPAEITGESSPSKSQGSRAIGDLDIGAPYSDGDFVQGYLDSFISETGNYGAHSARSPSFGRAKRSKGSASSDEAHLARVKKRPRQRSKNQPPHSK